MSSSLFGYLIFVVVLCALTLVIGPMFYLSEVVVVFVATLCVFKYLRGMSLLVLSAIVVVITVVFPFFVLLKMSEGSSLSLIDYLIPTNIDNFKVLLNFVMPYLAFIITATTMRKIKKE